MDILRGAYDLHVHASPSLAQRRLTAIEAIKLASEAGMAGVMFLDHTTMTTPIARVVNELGFSARAFGGVLLNRAAGGLCPQAVEAIIQFGTKQIQMPTYDAQAHIDRYGADTRIFPYQHTSEHGGIRVLDESGALRVEVEECLDVVAAHADAIFLGTGHLSVPESVALVRRAQERGIRRILLTSVSTDVVDMPIAVQQELTRVDGVLAEHNLMAITSIPHCPTTIARIASDIRAVGAERCILATDAGQLQIDDLVSGMRRFVELLLAEGVEERAIELMIKRNPAALLGIDED